MRLRKVSAPGRSPDSGAKFDVRSSTERTVSGVPKFSVLPIAVMAGRDAPGNEPGRTLPPTPVLALMPSMRNAFELGR